MESRRQQKQLKKDNLLLPWVNKVERTEKTKESPVFAVSLRQKGKKEQRNPKKIQFSLFL